jgi:ubiquinone/menaquinone biosynthesis C-methylase UbiE
MRRADQLMSDRYSLEQIRAFWTGQAREHGQAAAASWSDQCVMEMEVREIVKFLSDGDRVLDVGCANGFSTVQFASQRKIYIRGLDYIPDMVDQARARLAAMGDVLRGTADFAQGDITALPESAGSYDRVITIRVLINLGTWERQLLGLRECARVLKPGGTLLVSEATVQGWRRLNVFRQEWGLTDIPMPPFNEYIDETRLVEDVPAELRLVEVMNFASSYYVGSRVLKPLLIQALGASIDPANPNMEWNRWFSQLPASGDYGTQKLFVFEKR